MLSSPLRNWIRKQFLQTRLNARSMPTRHRTRTQLRVEYLEDRWVPSLTSLASFTNANGLGENPQATLVEDSHGNFFGTTNGGGAFNDGTIFEIAAGSRTITTLAAFNGSNGAYPAASLVEDSSGNFFGTTRGGGANLDGAVFEVAAGSSSITALASFNIGNGEGPIGNLVEDSHGNLFGTTQLGGSSSQGTVFEVAAGTGTITTLASFSGTNGASPCGGVVEDSQGNLFGIASAGGASSDGTVFELASGSHTITTLANFSGTNGANPFGGLIEDSSGDFFGTTENGGAAQHGTVFELAAGSSTVTTLASFNGTNGENPYDCLLEDSSGNLFGTAYFDSTYVDGTVFELAARSGTITTLANFYGANGANPIGGLIEDSSGNLFGTTDFGGASNLGTVFEVQRTTTSVEASSQFAIFGTTNQAMILNATVTSSDGNPVNEGSVIFAVYNGVTQIGTSAVSAGVANGSASATYTLPAGTPAGSYSIHVGYSGSVVYGTSNDLGDSTFPTLTVGSVTDNGQSGYSETGTGWTSFSASNAYNGSERYAAPGTGANTATWETSGLAAGIYNVEISWTAFFNRATNATYKVYDGATPLGSVQVDQQLTPTGGLTISSIPFESLGRFTIDSGTVSVVLSDNANGYVIANAMIAQPATIPAVIANSQFGYSQTASGWTPFVDPSAYLGIDQYAAPGSGANTATWQASGLAAGVYDVEMDWTACVNRATNATYKVFDGATLLGTVQVNQQLAPSGGATSNGTAFESLGRFTIDNGSVSVVLSDSANGYVVADAMLVRMATSPAVIDNSQYGYSETGAGWTSFSDPNAYYGNERYAAPGSGANTATWGATALAPGAYNLEVDWTAYSNRATNAVYQIFDGATLLAAVQVNQQLAPTSGAVVNNVAFQNLGRFTINSGIVSVVLSDNANGFVIADAMLIQVATGPVLVDNGHYGFSTTGSGWISFNDPKAYNGNERYAAPGTGANTATWQASSLPAGAYNVEVDWTAFPNRATNATYQVFDGASLLGTVQVNQQATPAGGATVNGITFQSLGRFIITSGTVSVVLSDNANGYIVVDAMDVQAATFPAVVDNSQCGYSETGTGWYSFNDPKAYLGGDRFAAPGGGGNTATWQVTDLASASYNVQVDWTAYTNRATNATYQVFDGTVRLATVQVNQELAPSGGATVNGVTFQSLGQFTITSGTLRVVLSDKANYYVIADAMLAM
jgi:uncharacterized repeat protein (TIGR03803 family)